MSEEEQQIEEENNEEQHLDIEEKAEDKNEINQGEENDNENKEEQVEQEQIQENQEQEDLNENENNEEEKDVKNDQNENINQLEENENEIGKDNEINENKEEEINIANNENEIDNNINNIQENAQQLEDEIINKEISIRSSKNNSNENINTDNGLSFGKQEINNFNINQKKNTFQILNEINNDMDLLEKDLRPIFNNSRIKMENRNYLYNNNDIMFEEFDQQNNEIKELIKKANKLVNEHTYNYYGHEGDKYREKKYNKNNLSEIYPYKRYEKGGNYNNYMERSENTSSEENNNDSCYMRNISPEKNINKHRIKNIRNIYDYNNSKNYNKRPMMYRQNETFPIKNSYMNEILGQPQTFQKYEYPNNLVFSSDKISFRNINHGGKINQSLDVLFNNQK